MSADHSFWREGRAESDSNRGLLLNSLPAYRQAKPAHWHKGGVRGRDVIKAIITVTFKVKDRFEILQSGLPFSPSWLVCTEVGSILYGPESTDDFLWCSSRFIWQREQRVFKVTCLNQFARTRTLIYLCLDFYLDLNLDRHFLVYAYGCVR